MTEDPFSGSSARELVDELRVGDYLGIAQHRKWWIILTTIAVSLTTWMAVRGLPDVYSAQTVILVDPQKVSNAYVSSTISSSIGERLSAIKQQVLSPSRLKRLISSMNLYPELRNRRSEQQIIEVLQKAISINDVASGGGRLTAFSIGVTGKNPVQVAQVANQLATMFVDENLKAREQQSNGTTEFLEAQLEQAKKQLEEKETDLRTIKSRYIMDLPESKQYHLEQLTTLRSQMKDIQDRVNRAQQEKVYLQAQNFAPVIDLDAGQSGGSSPYQSQIEKLETRLAELRSHYGTNHPDVRKVQKELTELQSKAAAEEQKQPARSPVQSANPAKASKRNPVLEAKIQQLDQEIEEQTRLQPQLQQQIDFHVSKLERVPIFEQQIGGLMRDYDNLRAHYSRLLDQKISADMADALESRQKGERFVVLDPAVAPEKPYAPNRFVIRLAGLLGGLLGGIVLAFMVEMADESVRNEREAARIMGKPVLVGIPLILSTQQRRWETLRAVAAVGGTAIGAVGLGFLIARGAEWIL